MKLINQSDYTKIVTELVPSCEQAATLCGNFLYYLFSVIYFSTIYILFLQSVSFFSCLMREISTLGDDGGDSCTYAYENCNSVFNEIIGIAGNINVRSVQTVVIQMDLVFAHLYVCRVGLGQCYTTPKPARIDFSYFG